MSKIYISTSWKNRELVRKTAEELRKIGHEVYDFTDPKCRATPEIPPEKFPEQFCSKLHVYSEYLNKVEWKNAVLENFRAVEQCDIILLLLPCGIDSTADWALGVGMGKKSIIIGSPKDGERSPVHLLANKMVQTTEQAIEWIRNKND